MKIREGFVSNSSSSSFICDVCGEEASGMNMSYDEAEMVCCKNGHTFCETHLLGDNTLEMLQDEDREDYDEDWRYDIPVEFCPVCQFNVLLDCDIVAYVKKEYSISVNELKQKLKNKFKTYNNFMDYLKS